MILDLDLLRFQSSLKVKRGEEGQKLIFDAVRRKWLVLQPEEMVRQLFYCYLTDELGYSKNRVAMERGLKVNTLQRRFDLLVYDKALSPFMLIECKAPQVKISQETFEQVSWYNTALRVKYLVVTNGMHTYCCWLDYAQKSFVYMDQLPLQPD